MSPYPPGRSSLSAHDVARLTRRPRWVLASLVLLGRFPRKCRYHGRGFGWLRSDVLSWLTKELEAGGCRAEAASIARRRIHRQGSSPLECAYRCAARRSHAPCSTEFPCASLIHPARVANQDCMSTLWRNRSRQILLSFPPSVRFRMRSSRGSSACAMRRATSAWTRTASTAKCVRGLNSCRLAHKVSRSIGLNSMRGRRTISLATGATWLKPKGASHGTR